jgi:hypothetical protein
MAGRFTTALQNLLMGLAFNKLFGLNENVVGVQACEYRTIFSDRFFCIGAMTLRATELVVQILAFRNVRVGMNGKRLDAEQRNGGSQFQFHDHFLLGVAT